MRLRLGFQASLLLEQVTNDVAGSSKLSGALRE